MIVFDILSGLVLVGLGIIMGEFLRDNYKNYGKFPVVITALMTLSITFLGVKNLYFPLPGGEVMTYITFFAAFMTLSLGVMLVVLPFVGSINTMIEKHNLETNEVRVTEIPSYLIYTVLGIMSLSCLYAALGAFVNVL